MPFPISFAGEISRNLRGDFDSLKQSFFEAIIELMQRKGAVATRTEGDRLLFIIAPLLVSAGYTWHRFKPVWIFQRTWRSLRGEFEVRSVPDGISVRFYFSAKKIVLSFLAALTLLISYFIYSKFPIGLMSIPLVGLLLGFFGFSFYLRTAFHIMVRNALEKTANRS